VPWAERSVVDLRKEFILKAVGADTGDVSVVVETDVTAI
jgi:hypothetical protein